jgi:hypothetical protein
MDKYSLNSIKLVQNIKAYLMIFNKTGFSGSQPDLNEFIENIDEDTISLRGFLTYKEP